MDAREAKRLRDEADDRQRKCHAHLVEIVVEGLNKGIEQSARQGRSSMTVTDRGVVAEITSYRPHAAIDGRRVSMELILKMLAEHYREVGFKTDIENRALMIFW